MSDTTDTKPEPRPSSAAATVFLTLLCVLGVVILGFISGWVRCTDRFPFMPAGTTATVCVIWHATPYDQR
jgi:hypothetical protein